MDSLFKQRLVGILVILSVAAIFWPLIFAPYDYREGTDFVDIIIVDIQGKVLLQHLGLYDQDRINLSGYVSGTYFVKIMTPEGSREIRVTKH